MGKLFRKFIDWLRQPAVWGSLLAILAIVLLTLAAYYFLGTWAYALAAALAIALIVLAFVLLRVVFAQEKEERFDRGISDRDDAVEARIAADASLEGIERSFLRAVGEIRGSRLGQGGLQALPWVLMMGESGAGKSAALRHSGLDLPAEYANSVGTGATRDIDWWLGNDAIVLDTAGRYLDAEDETTAHEWATLLRLLRKHRPDCPLDALVVTLPISSLFGRGPVELEAQAHALRRRVNQIHDELGVDLPIYLWITKSDLIEGFVETLSALPADRHGEAIGWTNPQREFAEAEDAAEEGLAGIVRNLEAILPELMLREPDAQRRRRIFLFPQELDEAIHIVADFAGKAFAPSVYDEVPFLRGVYFTSARREGVTYSPLLHRLGHDWARSHVDGSGGSGGLFLRDALHEIVIGDQNLAIPSDRFAPRARKLVHFVAGGALAALTLWWIAATAQNYAAIASLDNEASAVVAGAPTLTTLDSLREGINENSQLSWTRMGGLGGRMQAALDRAKETYLWGFAREFESPTKKRLKGAVRGYDDAAFEALAQLAQDVTWMGKRADEKSAKRPELAPYSSVARNERDAAMFRRGYDDFVRWSPEHEIRVRIEDEREVVASGAAKLLELARLESWSESNAGSYPPARYADAGIVAPDEAIETQVSGAYTRSGWEGLVAGLISAIDLTGSASTLAVDQFRRGYINRFETRWRNLLLDTPLPERADPDVKRSPYLALVDTIHENTWAELPREGSTPPWILTLRRVRSEEPVEAAGDGEPTPAPWTRYQAALDLVGADVAAATERGEQALDIAIRMAEGKPTSFGEALSLLRDLVPAEGDPQAATKLRQVLSMPILDGASAVLDRAASELDRRWRDGISQPFAGGLNARDMEALYAAGNGELSKFRGEVLGPFYEDGKRKSVLEGRELPLGPEFLAWMRRAEEIQRALYPGGAGGASIGVRLAGIPSKILNNRDLRVSRRQIRLSCDEVVQEFVYREGGGSGQFQWSPDCTELSVRIWVLDGPREVELMPRYEKTGPLAFPRFLNEAQPLSRRRYQWRLRYQQPDVELEVQYRLGGGEAILAIRHRTPPTSLRN